MTSSLSVPRREAKRCGAGLLLAPAARETHSVDMKRALAGPMLMLIVGVASACGGADQPPAQTATASAQQRLQGEWRLLSFQPNLALEEPLKGLLDAQLSTLSINIANGEFVARGPNVDTSGRVEIMSAQGDSLTGRVYDRAGAGYNISGTFVGAQFQFVTEDPPWAGRGVLERAR